jgi:hypothetical protein
MRGRFLGALILIAGPLSGQTGAAAIHAVAEYALNYTKSLPDYTCTLTTRQVATATNAGNVTPPQMTKIEEQLSFIDGKEVRRITRIDGRPASAEAASALKESTEGEFGGLLAVIFKPETGTDLRWDRAATLNKRMVDVIAFRVPQAKGYVLNGVHGSVRVPFEGFIYADAQTHAVMRVQMKCVMVPEKFEMQNFDLTLDYKAARVAGHEAILPFHFLLNYRDYADDRLHSYDGQYSAYLQFRVDASSRVDGDRQ